MTVQQKLRGTGVALVTPFAKDRSIDFTALGKVIDHVIDGGVEYLITLGTTGETPTLSKEEKMAIIAFTFSHTADRVPIIVGVGGNNTAEVINDLQNFPLDKALAILSVVPFYNKPSQEGIYQHYKTIAAASPKPVISTVSNCLWHARCNQCCCKRISNSVLQYGSCMFSRRFC